MVLNEKERSRAHIHFHLNSFQSLKTDLFSGSQNQPNIAQAFSLNQGQAWLAADPCWEGDPSGRPKMKSRFKAYAKRGLAILPCQISRARSPVQESAPQMEKQREIIDGDGIFAADPKGGPKEKNFFLTCFIL